VQARDRVFAVLLEAAALLRLDDDDAFARDTLVTARENTRLDRLGQRRGAHVEAQVHRVGDLVDVLPARCFKATTCCLLARNRIRRAGSAALRAAVGRTCGAAASRAGRRAAGRA